MSILPSRLRAKPSSQTRPSRYPKSWSLSPLEARVMLAADAGLCVCEQSTASDHDLESQIVFVDSEVTESAELIELVQAGAEVVLIDSANDPIRQMTSVLSRYHRVSAVHVISHGQAGELQLGGQVINTKTLDARANELKQWRSALTDDADILLYGCDVASGDVGGQLMYTLAQLTGADIAGSTNRTGSRVHGGDWNLERTTGGIESTLVASLESLTQVDVVLPITIRAAGNEGEEEMQLQIDGVTVQTFGNIGGDPDARQFNTFTYNSAPGVTADQVRIVFSNDLYDEANGIDRNLVVDSISIDGRVFETEAPTVYSNASWTGDTLIPGFVQSETLHSNGYFQYAESPTNSGSQISIYAAGNENSETMQLWIAGTQVAEFNNIGGNAYGRQFVKYDYTASEVVTPDQVQVRFTNDLYENNGLVDRNLRIDRIVIDGTTFQTEAADVYSTGTWDGAGITPGFKQDEMLHTNGYFQYAANSAPVEPGVISMETSNVSIDEAAGTVSIDVVRNNGSDGQITVDFATVNGTAIAGQDYSERSGTITFADGEIRKSIVVPILNDSAVESTEQFNVTIDNVTGGATLLVPRTATVTIVDDEVLLPNYANFNSVVGLNLNGDAVRNGNSLQLTTDELNKVGSAFFNQALTLDSNASFRSSFSFELNGSSSGADGFAFVVQNDPSRFDALGSSGGSLGYDGITKSVAVEFDTYKNGSYDVNANHVSILNGTTVNSIRTAIPELDLNNGNRIYAWVDYNGVSDNLSVYLSSNATKPRSALMKTTIDLAQAVGSSGYFGFTGATGGLTNQHLIRHWTLDQTAPPLDPPTEIGDTVVAVDVLTNLHQPTAVSWLPTGTMLVAQQNGVVRTATNGNLNSSPFIDISAIVNGTRDRGLLDIAVHPDFDTHPYVYLLFTYDPPEVFNQAAGSLAGPDGNGNRAGRLIRVTADSATGYTTAVAGSEVILLGKNSTWDNFNGFVNSTFDFTQPPAGENPDSTYIEDFINSDSESHSIGSLAFAPDGSLYVSIGDGASYNRVDVRADRVQDIDSLSGKVLRIDPITGKGLSDNPFFNGDEDANRSKVYQLGLRNPFRIAVDESSGQLFVGDVGWTRWEEINAAGPGANFGWPFYEGRNDGVLEPQPGYLNTPEGQAWLLRNETVTAGVYALSHQADGINAIIMGDVYDGALYGSKYQGDVFFNDLGQGIVRHASVNPDGSFEDVSVFTTGANVVVDITQGPDGALYYIDLNDNKVGRWELV
ncbi:DUF4347 domain-containing protein [Rubripirellula amarantea]|nr:DUF4347 domain-containing protein [Rubripirellula amarantea]